MYELQAQGQIAIIPVLAILFACTIVGSAYLRKRGKTAEELSLVNTFLILVAIILILFPIP